jgi:hypothetical protein
MRDDQHLTIRARVDLAGQLARFPVGKAEKRGVKTLAIVDGEIGQVVSDQQICASGKCGRENIGILRVFRTRVRHPPEYEVRIESSRSALHHVNERVCRILNCVKGVSLPKEHIAVRIDHLE